jgi:hypothetical protein
MMFSDGKSIYAMRVKKRFLLTIWLLEQIFRAQVIEPAIHANLR